MITQDKPKGTHSSVTYCCFKNFNEGRFLADLQATPFYSIFDITNPDIAVQHWLDLFMCAVEKNAPIKSKRVKKRGVPPWFTSDLREAMNKRDTLKAERKFEEYKKQRNLVTYLIRAAKKKYFERLAGTKGNTRQLWQAVNTLTKGHSSTKKSLPSNLSLIHI